MLNGGKIALLIVEDDPQMRRLVEAAAARTASFDPIVSVGDGAAALEWLHQPDRLLPDLIVSDLSMPRVDGTELVRELKRDEATRHIPIAIITSSDLPNDRETALGAGACAFLPKPYGVESLTRLLQELRDTCVNASTGAPHR